MSEHGKTLMKNMGRVIGMTLLFLLVIGGAFFALFFAVFSRFPAWFSMLAAEIAEAAARNGRSISEYLTDPDKLLPVAAGLAALILWSILHSVFVRPYVLVGVLRNYIQSGVNEIPSEASFSVLDGKSAKFRKLHTEGV